MYEFLDRPVTSLDKGGRFLVWSMRIWVKTVGESNCPVSAIAPAFAKWQMIGGLAHFHKAMLMFNRDALETFGFCSLHCNHVSEHEAIILSLICSLRDSRPQAVRDTLALIVEEERIGDLLAALSSLGRSMDEAEIFPTRMIWEAGKAAPGA